MGAPVLGPRPPGASPRSGTISAERCLETYLQEINEVPLLTAEQERSWDVASTRGDLEAREHLIRANLRLVVSIAKMYCRARALAAGPDRRRATSA